MSIAAFVTTAESVSPIDHMVTKSKIFIDWLFYKIFVNPLI